MNKKIKVYIAGKITGLTIEEAAEKFIDRETELLDKGYEVVNPIRINPIGTSWDECMFNCIMELAQCSHISLLDNYKDSKGAQMEAQIAEKMGLIRI